MISPKISIVTINLNNRDGLDLTIKSVIHQNFGNFEFIVIDGASSDGSVELIGQYAGSITNWISEKDTGIYNAMNKGIKLANGEYIIFMNSGDQFKSKDSLNILASGGYNADIIFGQMEMLNEKGNWIKKFPSIISFEFFLKDSLPHAASLIRKSLFTTIDLYDETKKVVSDWEFFLHAICRYNTPYRYVKETVSVFNENGVSSNPASFELMKYERDMVLNTHYSAFLPDYILLDKYRSELNLINISRVYKWALKFRNSKIGKILIKS